MVRPNHVVTGVDSRYSAASEAASPEARMQYLPLFLLLMAVLIAAYFYLENAKKRDAKTDAPKAADPASAAPAAHTGSERPE